MPIFELCVFQLCLLSLYRFASVQLIFVAEKLRVPFEISIFDSAHAFCDQSLLALTKAKEAEQFAANCQVLGENQAFQGR